MASGFKLCCVLCVSTVAAMFLGMHQSTLLLPSPWAMHVLIGYVTWLVLFRLLLLIQKYLSIKQGIKSFVELIGNVSKYFALSCILTVVHLTAPRSDEQHFILSVQSEHSRWVGTPQNI